MEEHNMQIEQRLWDYIDGNSKEKSAIEELIATNSAWKAKYAELLHLSSLLRESEMDAPSMRFTKNVMEEISRLHVSPAASTYINKKIIWSIATFFCLMIVGFLIYGFAQVQFTSSTDKTISENVNRIDFSKFFSNTNLNMLMMVNLVVGLFLLDNYLTRRKKAFRNEFK
jgi:anti-sigma factor RsiW